MRETLHTMPEILNTHCSGKGFRETTSPILFTSASVLFNSFARMLVGYAVGRARFVSRIIGFTLLPVLANPASACLALVKCATVET